MTPRCGEPSVINMAKLTAFAPFGPDNLTFGDFKSGDFSNGTSKSFHIDAKGGVDIDVDGSGFKYQTIQGEKVVTSGTVHSIEVSLGDGSPVFTLSDVDISIKDILKVASTKSLADDFKLIEDIFEGKDKLTGGDGDDVLAGFRGNDVLAGGAGNDRLDGGKENDVFRFSEFGARNADHIKEFGGSDMIELSSAVFSELDTDSQGISKEMFSIGSKATTSEERLIYNDKTGKLFYDADGVGGEAQELIATFDDKHALGRGDIDLF